MLQEREERVGPKDMGGVANGGTGAAKSQERREQCAVGDEEEEACLSDHSDLHAHDTETESDSSGFSDC